MPAHSPLRSLASYPRAPRFLALRRRSVLIWTLPIAAASLVGVLLGAAIAATIHVPEVESIVDYAPGLITAIRDRSGETFHEYLIQRRVMLEEGEVPKQLQDALLVSEDRRFFEHAGVDVRGVARAALRNLLNGERGEGASTLTMQAAGTIFLNRQQRTWKRKISEAFYAVELEKTLSKQQILTLYCNHMNLGHGNYGFEAAARYYFDKTVGDLSLAEAATLVAILPYPNVWTPIRRPEFLTGRRDIILKQMRASELISAEQLKEALATPLRVAPRQRKSQRGVYFAEDVRRYLYSAYGEHALYEGGLQVRTTLDRRIQAAAEDALRRGLFEVDARRRSWRGPIEQLELVEGEDISLPSWTALGVEPGAWVRGVVLTSGSRRARVLVAEHEFELQPKDMEWTGKSKPSEILSRGDVAWFEIIALPSDPEQTPRILLVQEPEVEGAVVVVESSTGAVRAQVGGWSYERSEFNRASQAHRQVGSAFKVFVFGAAYENGFSPADTLFDAPAVFAGANNLPTYSPRNYKPTYYGITTLRRALERSINVTSVKLQDLIGAQQVVDFARRCGIQSPLPPYPSLALGVAELSPLELAAAYAAIANQGLYVEPYMIESVSTPDGRVLESHRLAISKAMEPEIAYLLTHTMRGVVQRGTGSELRTLSVPIAGKTGTTDGFTDAWFAGFTPRYTIVTWVGYDRKRSLGRGMTGAEVALPIWKKLAERGLEEGWITQDQDFAPPPGITFRSVERLSGLLAENQISLSETDVLREAFLAGTEPVQEYSTRWRRVMELPWYQQRAFYGKPKEGENMPEDIEDWSLVVKAREGSR